MAYQAWQGVSHPGSFSSAKNVSLGLKKRNGQGKSLKNTQDQLKKHVLFQAHRDLRQIFPKRHVATTNFSEKWELDLGELPGRLKARKSELLYLVAVDSFSKKIFARGMPNKSAPCLIRTLQHIFDHLEAPYTVPSLIETDRGKEFDNAQFKKFCQDKNIRLKFAYGMHKARMAERGVRSLKRTLMAAKQTGQYPKKPWPDLVTLFAQTLGQRYNRSIGMSPDDAPTHYPKLLAQAWDAKQLVPADQYFEEAQAIEPGEEGLLTAGERFRLGDTVLMPTPKQRAASVKDKEHLMHYKLMPRIIDKIYHFQKPPLFRLRNAQSGEKEKRLYYPNELKRVTLPAEARDIVDYRIKKGPGLQYQLKSKEWVTAA